MNLGYVINPEAPGFGRCELLAIAAQEYLICLDRGNGYENVWVSQANWARVEV